MVRQQFTMGLLPLARQWRRAVDAALAPIGLSEALAWPLITLEGHGGGLRQVELAAALDIGEASLVRLLARLEDMHLLERRSDPDDGRVKRVHLTPDGAAMVAHIHEAADRLRAIAMAGISDAELDQCLHVFKRLRSGIDAAIPAFERNRAR